MFFQDFPFKYPSKKEPGRGGCLGYFVVLYDDPLDWYQRLDQWAGGNDEGRAVYGPLWPVKTRDFPNFWREQNNFLSEFGNFSQNFRHDTNLDEGEGGKYTPGEILLLDPQNPSAFRTEAVQIGQCFPGKNRRLRGQKAWKNGAISVKRL